MLSIVVALHFLCVLVWWVQDRLTLPTKNDPIQKMAYVFLPPMSQTNERQSLKRNNLVSEFRRPGQSLPDSRIPSFSPPTPLDASEEKSINDSAPGSEASITESTGLNLQLSRQALQAISANPSARVYSENAKIPKSIETLIAGVFADTGPVIEERIDDDHIRFRRGTTCVIVERPRTSTIFPFSDAAQRIPWAAGNPYKC